MIPAAAAGVIWKFAIVRNLYKYETKLLKKKSLGHIGTQMQIISFIHIHNVLNIMCVGSGN